MIIKSEVEIAWACQQLVLKAGRFVDANEPDRLREVFAKDAVQHVRGQVQQGVETIISAVKVPLIERVLCHMISPTIVTVDADGKRARGITNVTVFRGKREGAVFPLPMEEPAGLAVYHDVYRPTGDGWRIVSREVQLVFGG